MRLPAEAPGVPPSPQRSADSCRPVTRARILREAVGRPSPDCPDEAVGAACYHID